MAAKAAREIDHNKTISVALVGNPNSGKTSVFNEMTGSRQHVGNWPGVTVEKKEGRLLSEGRQVRVVDLPGIYSLGAYSEDEIIARDHILLEKPDVVVDIVDSTNIERNLYLTLQLLEMGANVVIALNMFDELKAKSMKVDAAKLSAKLGVPVVPTIAVRNQGISELIHKVIESSQAGFQAGSQVETRQPLKIDYGEDLESELSLIEQYLKGTEGLAAIYPPRWLAIKLLEGDEGVIGLIGKGPHRDKLLAMRDEAIGRLESSGKGDFSSSVADRRYELITGIVREAVTSTATASGMSVSDKIDRIVTNRFLGLPIFLAAMWVVFQLTFSWGAPLVNWIDGMKGLVAGAAADWLASMGSPEILTSLIVDGLIEGVGSVLVFMPNIFLLFFAISLLEDSGYMARTAYIVDRLMHTFGLHGKSFIPFLVGFGCNVPAIMATRTLDNRKDRMLTILIIPLMSCTARLPVYVLFAGAFFGARQGLVVFSLYILGMVLAVLVGVLLKRFIFRGETSHFVMELPPYRMPTLKSTLLHMWDRGSSFISKAGTVILIAVVLVWLLANLPPGVQYASTDSVLGKIGGWLAPVFKPAGFGTWEAAVALIAGIMAKEVVVGTLGVLYGVGEEGLTAAIAQRWTPLSAYAFMVMTLLYIPCVAVIGTIKRETNSWGWTLFAVSYTLALGWIMAVLVFQVGRLLGLG